MGLWITPRLLPSESCPVIRSPAPVSAVPMARSSRAQCPNREWSEHVDDHF
ncbi:hypothetical protein Rhow_006468 [Rhodococcus wratislaviensis]|uniref:Uncharacterized protein n=1 Tax=Rhodococcus wratislaviensis TaxID=44752 RepID=A0A402C0C1_RHOWR|nr:hypothetical protein Rhow_006468 [Rhodococcus wratislaviensis]